MTKGTDGAMRTADVDVVPLVRLKQRGDTEVTPTVAPDPESLARLRLASVPPGNATPAESAGRLHRPTHARIARPGSLPENSETPDFSQPQGNYQVAETLASGGMGSVHLAVQRGARGFARIVAIKRIHPHLMANQKFCEMFIDEARIASRINHGSVCRIFDFGEDQDGYFIAMEYLVGEPLSRVLRAVRDRRDLTNSSHYALIMARIVAGVAEGLHAAHTLQDDQGEPLRVVHRDVSPQNLFVLYDGTVRVTDFGIAQARQRLHHTHSGSLKGKLCYMAPEQLERKPLDGRVDVWSLGVVFWEALTMRRLFRGNNEGETLLRVMSKPIPPPSMLNPSVPAGLDSVVRRALARDPAERYASAREMARDIERFLASVGDTVPTMDLAEWLTDVFPDGMARSSRRLKAALSPSGSSAHGEASFAMVSDESIPPTGDSLSTPPNDWPEATTGVRRIEAFAETAPARPRRAATEQPRPPSRWSDVLIVGTLALALVAAGFAYERAIVAQPQRAQAPVPKKPAVIEQSAPKQAPIELPSAPPSQSPQPAVSSAPLLKHVEVPERRPKARAATAAPQEASPTAAQSADRFELGTVFVNVNGSAADVYEGSTLLGRAPARAQLKAGAHQLTVRAANGATQNLSVNVAAGAVSLLTVSFTAPGDAK